MTVSPKERDKTRLVMPVNLRENGDKTRLVMPVFTGRTGIRRASLWPENGDKPRLVVPV